MHGNKVDNHITTKLWNIKPFWSVYLQDNYQFKDLNIQKRGLIFRNGLVQIGPKFKHGFSTQEGHSALLECRLAQIAGTARGLLD